MTAADPGAPYLGFPPDSHAEPPGEDYDAPDPCLLCEGTGDADGEPCPVGCPRLYHVEVTHALADYEVARAILADYWIGGFTFEETDPARWEFETRDLAGLREALAGLASVEVIR